MVIRLVSSADRVCSHELPDVLVYGGPPNVFLGLGQHMGRTRVTGQFTRVQPGKYLGSDGRRNIESQRVHCPGQFSEPHRPTLDILGEGSNNAGRGDNVFLHFRNIWGVRTDKIEHPASYS